MDIIDDLWYCKAAHDVAALLRKNGVKGKKDDYNNCPIAMYIKKFKPTSNPIVGVNAINIDGIVYFTTNAVSFFIMGLDSGFYEDLVDV